MNSSPTLMIVLDGESPELKEMNWKECECFFGNLTETTLKDAKKN
jgi:hypothetical protein